MGDMDQAVDHAMSVLSGSGNPPPAEAPAPSSSNGLPSAPVTPARAPTTGPGLGSASDTSGSTVEATRPPEDDDGDTLAAPEWLDLEKRRTILKSARAKERATLLRDLGLSPEMPIDRLRPHLSLMMRDIGEYHRQLTDALQRQGILQAPPPPAPAAPAPSPSAPATPEPIPQPDLVFADGRRAYSAEGAAALVQWAIEGLRSDVVAEMEERLSPLQQTHQQLRAQEIRRVAHDQAAGIMAEASTWAHFDEFREKIADMIQADKRHTVFSAYNRLLQEKLKTESARLKEQTRTETLQEIRSARPGAPSIVPGQAPVAAQRKTGGTLDDLIGQAVTRAYATATP